jgi:hypothetical protein
MMPLPPSPCPTSTTLTPTPRPRRPLAPSVPLLPTPPLLPLPRCKRLNVPRPTSSRVSRHPATRMASIMSDTAAMKRPTRMHPHAAKRVLTRTAWLWISPQASAALCGRTLATTVESRSRSRTASLMVLASLRRLDVAPCSLLENGASVS